MSGVAAYSVGFLLCHGPTHTHTSAADVIHVAVQMHITTSLHTHTYTVTPTSGTRSIFSDLLAAFINSGQNTEVINNTKKMSYVLFKQMFLFKRNGLIVHFLSMINLIPTH